jgi:hypothetical protein
MSEETEKPDFADVLKQRMREIDEASERWRREHPDEVTAEAGAQASASAAGEPREGKDARIVQWEDEMRRYADENGGLVPARLSGLFDDGRRQVRLTDGRAETAACSSPLAPSAAPSDTEKLLNGLIEECRALLRDVAFRSACLTPDADERIRFLTAAQNLATTGANVGKVVARLRGPNAPVVEERRHRMIYEHTQTTVAPPSPRGDVP